MGGASTRSRIRPPCVRHGGLVGAFTWAGLLVGMYLEHVAGVTEMGVWLFGRLHGAAFLAYCATTLLASWVLRWNVRVTLVALVASVPPLATALFEVVARRRGLLTLPNVAGPDRDRPGLATASSDR